MARNKKSEIPHYELLYIVPNKYTKDELKPIIEEVNKTITDHSGEITYSENWGNKKLAYKIQHFTHGYYNLVEFSVAGVNMAKIDKILRMSEKILRHQIIKIKKRDLEEIKKEKEKQIIRIKEDTKQVETNSKVKNQKSKVIKETSKPIVEEKKIVEEKNTSTESIPQVEKEEKKMNLEDLDDKLDKILETNDLL